MTMIPTAGPRLTRSVTAASASLPCVGVLEQELALVDGEHDRVQAEVACGRPVAG